MEIWESRPKMPIFNRQIKLFLVTFRSSSFSSKSNTSSLHGDEEDIRSYNIDDRWYVVIEKIYPWCVINLNINIYIIRKAVWTSTVGFWGIEFEMYGTNACFETLSTVVFFTVVFSDIYTMGTVCIWLTLGPAQSEDYNRMNLIIGKVEKRGNRVR